MFRLFRNQLKIFRLAFTSWAATIGTIIATVALCNMFFRVMGLPVAEILRLVLSAYQKTFHPPIDYIFSVFSIRVPAVAKDLVVLYLATGGVLYRTLSYEQSSPLKKAMRDAFLATMKSRMRDLRMKAGTILVAVFWPYFLKGLLRHPSFLIVSAKGYHGRMPPVRRDFSPAQQKEALDKMFSLIGPGATVLCNERQLFVSYLVGLLAAACGLVILNDAIDSFSTASR